MDEETHRESEKKKVKKDAALFKRNMKDVQARMRELRSKEDLKRQESYLDEAYKERRSQEEQEAEWDPIEDVIADERDNYIDLIKYILLMMKSVDDDGEIALQELSIKRHGRTRNFTCPPPAPSLLPSLRSQSKRQQQMEIPEQIYLISLLMTQEPKCESG